VKVFIYSPFAVERPKELSSKHMVRAAPVVNPLYLSAQQLAERADELQDTVIGADVIVLLNDDPTSAYLAGFAAARGVPVVVIAARVHAHNPMFDTGHTLADMADLPKLLANIEKLHGIPAPSLPVIPLPSKVVSSSVTVADKPPTGDTSDDPSSDIHTDGGRPDSSEGEDRDTQQEAGEPSAPAIDVGGEAG